ncbi:Pleckstrin homology domain-containing family M member 3 [Morella rubra]|uniref:Pleckstrin homology domain-containing family M member 3 n=1 Tax=Morella rubra TaxID=262757 RepID=A0A6A1VV22_9ROSI|nr:Pleckstrin homology domain-containing family M member 3 [Morella rubra]
MINGEGTRRATSEVASPDPSNSIPKTKSDGGGDSDGEASPSQYSSCGESEFERYCSANSVMGTPSMCSSITTFNDCLESELFGSMRSDSGLENFSLGWRFDRDQGDRILSGPNNECLGDRNAEFQEGSLVDEEMGLRSGARTRLELYDSEHLDLSQEMMGLKVDSGSEFVAGTNDGMVEGVGSEDNIERSIGLRAEGVSEVSQGSENVSGKGAISVEHIDGCGNFFRDEVRVGSSSRFVGEGDGSCNDRLNFPSDLQSDGRETEREEDGTSSRYEHSEGEDSMYYYGTGDESRDHFYVQRNVHYGQGAKGENENPLLINSSVAFGSQDWDDFEQEMEGGPLASLTLDAFQDLEKQNPDTEENLKNSNFMTSILISSTGHIDHGQILTDMSMARKQVRGGLELANDIDIYYQTANITSNLAEAERVEGVRDHPEGSSHVQSGDEVCEYTRSSVIPTGSSNFNELDQEAPRDATATKNQAQAADESVHSTSTIFQMEPQPLAEKVPVELALNIMDIGMERAHQSIKNDKVIGICDSQVLENQDLQKSKENLDIYGVSINQLGSNSTISPENLKVELFEDHENTFLPSASEKKMKMISNSPSLADICEDHPAPPPAENLDISEFYDEFVHEMEEILLDSGKTPEDRFSQDDGIFDSQLSLRDGGSTASTSGTDDAYPLFQNSPRIDGVEVVGARQRKGDISFSERLVGVKEFTVYNIRVWSGNDQWEVERRYRDFFTLYCQLKSLFADQGWILPSPWSSVEKESRKIFGSASPDVISERSVLIQDCLCSILHSRLFSSPPSALISFLSPQDSFASSPMSNTLVPQSTSFASRADTESSTPLGKTISLIVEIHPHKSIKQMLEAQHYACAGCHKHFDDGKTAMRDFVQTFGWGKPRLCEYTGQLYCSSCHTNETAILPARVLHHWDFTQCSVSQLARSFLDSIHDQPMLCVSAVNPFLFSKVPTLQHVMGVRRKIGTMLPYVRCPFRRTINKGVGSRRYLLESNDFFALRDLIDLSKGPFAALPVMVETVSRKIREHITERCLICCDVGVPCGARQLCNDPSALIFPFQDGEVERCSSCESLFHRHCFRKLTNCPCGTQFRLSKSPSDEGSRALDLLGRRSDSGLSVGLFSGLFAKANLVKTREHKDSDNVILMGSLPSTSL